MDCGEGRADLLRAQQSLDDSASCSGRGWLWRSPLAEGLWEPLLTGQIWTISLGAHLPVAAGVGVPGLDNGHALAHGAVLGHTDGRVGRDVEPGAVVILVQHSDVDLRVNMARDLPPSSPP